MATKDKIRRKNIAVDVELHAEVKHLACDIDKTMSEIVEEAVRAKLAKSAKSRSRRKSA